MHNNMHNDMGMGGFGFGGFGFGSGISQHMNAMNSMMNMQSSFPNDRQQQQGNTRSYSSSSTSFGRGNNNVAQESVSTSTRIINGKRQTVTERVKVHPDGRVERTTETSGDDFPSGQLGYNDNGHNNFLSSSSDGRSYPESRDSRSQNERKHAPPKSNDNEPREIQKKRRFFH